MNFDFSEEQTMLRDSVARYLHDSYPFETRRAIADSATGMSPEQWQVFAELGWLSVPFAQEYGGFGGGAVDTMLLMEQFGKGLVLEPYLATVLLFGGLLQRSGNTALQGEYLPRIIAGECQGAFAYLERQSRFELCDVATRAETGADGCRLSGEKVVVFNGASADTLIVSARTSGGQSDEQGISLFLVPADAPGVRLTSFKQMDSQKLANITFDQVAVAAGARLGEEGQAMALVHPVVRSAIVALSAEALGIMGQLNAKTLEYTKTRRQFGVQISSFQALQHRMVETFMSYEQTKSLLYRTVCELEEGAATADATVHALKVMVDRAGKHVFGEAIQLHGGMGITDELDIGHYVKRLMMINTIFGSGGFHQAAYDALRYG
ncbi:MAG: acyl-CoA dehydrogenase family protein [Parahaliea sp.]